jgi:hypothetical protein
MGEINLLAVVLGAAAFFMVGALWYTVLFGKAWQRETGYADEVIAAGPKPGQNPRWLIFGLCFAFEMLVSLMLGHNIARTSPAPHVIMMMAVGFGALLMVPAIGINYLYQMNSGKLFAIDAGHLIAGCAAMGAVHMLLG